LDASLDIVESACLIDTSEDHEHCQTRGIPGFLQGYIAADNADNWLAVLKRTKPGNI